MRRGSTRYIDRMTANRPDAMPLRQRSLAPKPSPNDDQANGDGPGKITSHSLPPAPASTSSSSTAIPSTTAGYSYARNLWLARLLRFLGPIGFFWHTWFLSPRGLRVSASERIPTRDGHEVIINIYRPSPGPSDLPNSSGSRKGRICIVNFHGGGWTIGNSTDDSRWARWCFDGLDAVFVSVEYRLAPEWPWPTPVTDCIDATRYILAHAHRLGVDKDKVVLSGFSAGGCLAVTTAMGLAHPHLQPGTRSTTLDGTESGESISISIKGIISFYPLLDFSTPRIEKVNRAKTPSLLRPLPGWMTHMFDTSYLPPPSIHRNMKVIDRTHPLISPLLAPDELLTGFPNVHLCLCERDVLAQEGLDMADRLVGMGKGEVVSRWVEGAVHGWDKPPHLVKQSVKDEYDAAVESVRRWCE